MKAYRITITSWPELTVLAVAETRGQAKSLVKLDTESAGWAIPFINFRAKRAKELDHLASGIPRQLLPDELQKEAT